MSFFGRFVDLSKAFDRLVREQVLGWPDELLESDRRQFLLDAGVPMDMVDDMLKSLEESPCAMEAAGVDETVAGLLRSLHTKAWFRIGSGPGATFVATRRGGRQGCKPGPVVFNMGYAIALPRMRIMVRKAGLS